MKDEEFADLFILHPSYFILNQPGCGVTQASESWELVATVQFCPPRPPVVQSPTSNVKGQDMKTAVGHWTFDFRLFKASLVQLVQDTALPAPRHRFESGTMLQLVQCPMSKVRWRKRDVGHWTCDFGLSLRPRSLTEERFASNESGMGSSPIGGSKSGMNWE